jgi:hypothetical protein
MNATAAFAKKTAAAIRKDRGNLGHNREPDFFGRFAADVEPCRRIGVSHTRFEIERSIFTEARQQFGVTLSWPEQANVAELERQNAIERKQIATEIVGHHQSGSLRVRTKVFSQCRGMTETLDNPAKIRGELCNRLDFGPRAEEQKSNRKRHCIY